MSLSGSVPKSQENSSRSGIKLLFSRLLSLFLNLMATFSKFSRESQIKSAFRKKTNPRILIRLKKNTRVYQQSEEPPRMCKNFLLFISIMRHLLLR